jgi:hypothetical protein
MGTNKRHYSDKVKARYINRVLQVKPPISNPNIS